QQETGVGVTRAAEQPTRRIEAGSLQIVEVCRQQAAGVIGFGMVGRVLVLEAEFERVLIPDPQEALLQGVVVVVILEVPRIRPAPARGRIGSRESRFQKSVARITGRQAFEAGLAGPLTV